MSPPPTADLPDEGGRNLCNPVEVRLEAPGTGRGENAWISEATWRLVNERVSALRDPAKDQALIWRLGRAIVVILKGNRRLQAEEEGKEV